MRNILPLDFYLAYLSFIFIPNLLTINFVIVDSMLKSRYKIAMLEKELILRTSRAATSIGMSKKLIDWRQSLLLLSHQITFDRISEGLFLNVAAWLSDRTAISCLVSARY